MQVAICDDEEMCQIRLKECVCDYFASRKIDYEIELFSTGKDLLAEKKRFDIIFLDIEMGQMDGLEVAERIRDYDINVPIIYVTNYSKYSLMAYKVHPFQFLTKPVDESAVEKVLNDYLRMLLEKEEKKIMLCTDTGIVSVGMHEIYYILLGYKRQVIIKTITREYVVKEKLSDIYEKLDKDLFYMSHRSCIVNLKYVKSLENDFDIIMINGDFCPLAQRRRNEFLEVLAKSCLSQLKGRIL